MPPQALSIPVSSTCICSDKKPTSQDFIRQAWRQRVLHCFETMEEHRQGTGRCLMHRSICTANTCKPDMCVAGPPCQPFSNLRQKNASTGSRLQAAEMHPDFDTSEVHLVAWLAARQPYTAIVEQVSSFAKPDASGESPCARLCERLRAQFEGIELVMLTPEVWCKASRPRLRGNDASTSQPHDVCSY